LIEQAVLAVLPPLSGALGGLILAHFRSNRALKACREARKACNDELHALKSDYSTLKGHLLRAESRIAGLEGEMERRLRPLEVKDASSHL